MYETHSLTMLGYDRRYDKYTAVGFDTWGTYFVAGTGSHDPDSETISFYFEDFHPTFQYMQKSNWNFRLVDENTFTLEIIFKDAAKLFGVDEFKMVEMTYKRVE